MLGIQGIESVAYSVEDLGTCVRFFTDFGLAKASAQGDRAVLTTLANQTVRLEATDNRRYPAAVESWPTIREVVWGVDTQPELERLLEAVGRDREVRADDDGVHRFADVSGFGVGLALSQMIEPDFRRVEGDNRWGSVGRWNQAITSVAPVRPLRICHVALNIESDDANEAVAFYVDRLGFTPTDIVKPAGTFMQCEGDADQHNLFLCHRPNRTGLNHVSFEVPSFDDVVEGGNHMIERGWREARKLGRHTVGSNVFRFIHAPCGGRVELAYDMDRVDASYGPRVHETAPPHHIWQIKSNQDTTEGEASR